MKVLASSCHRQLTLLPAPPECGQAELIHPAFQSVMLGMELK